MGLALDIVRTWRHPRQVMARFLSQGQREDRVFMFLMFACALIFLSRWPGLVRLSLLNPDTPLNILLGGALFGWLFIVPPAAYVLAAFTRLTARLFGGQGSWYSARLALFWSLLAAAPFWIVNGLVSGYGVPDIWQKAVGAIALAAFLLIWLSSLHWAEFHESGHPE
ncbi:MAG: YIP1 family protein [Paracoccaceae bacterium]